MMTAWHKGPLLAYDCESTGVDVENDRIVTACTAVIRPADPDPEHRVQVRSWLIDPGVDIPAEATAVHGITSEFAKLNGDPADGALHLIAAELALALNAGVPIVGMNLAYDLTILDRELRRHGRPTVEERLDGRPLAPVIDVLCIDKQVDPYRPGKRKLTDLCGHYGVRIDGAHDSTFDALAAARVAYRIGQRAQMDSGNLAGLYAGRKRPEEIVRAFQRLGRMSLAELHDAQVRWRYDQQASLAEHFRRKGQDASDVDGSWPMREWTPELAQEEANLR